MDCQGLRSTLPSHRRQQANLRRPGAVWLPAAARRDGWLIEYPDIQGTFPGTVRLRSEGGTLQVDLTARLSQLEANSDLSPDVFDVDVPGDTAPMTLEELRESGPLRGAR